MKIELLSQWKLEAEFCNIVHSWRQTTTRPGFYDSEVLVTIEISSGSGSGGVWRFIQSLWAENLVAVHVWLPKNIKLLQFEEKKRENIKYDKLFSSS